MKTIGVLLLLLGLVGSTAMAETYRCRDADGVLIFTDDPSNLPPDCRKEPEDRTGGVSVIANPPVQTGDSAAKEFLSEKVPRKEEQNDPIKEWKEEAESLAEDYQQALKLRYQTMPVSEKRKVLRRISEIKERRDALLKEVTDSLPPQKREEIENTLATIPP